MIAVVVVTGRLLRVSQGKTILEAAIGPSSVSGWTRGASLPGRSPAPPTPFIYNRQLPSTGH